MLVFHVDCNFVSLRPEFVRRLLRQIAALSYDTVLWELEDQVRWDNCPECALPDSWTKDEFREILDYARKLNLESIPLLQTVGHGEYVMMQQQYHSFREQADYSDCYCVSNPAVRSFMRRWISEYCELFGELKYFHLGGDEAYRFGSCPQCSRHERNALYGEYIDFLAADLKKRHIRPGVWCDMILAHPATVNAISKDFVIWDWNYNSRVEAPETVRVWGAKSVDKAGVTPEQRQQFPEILTANGELNQFYTVDFLQSHGFEVILCSAVRSWADGPFCPNVPEHAPNIVSVAEKCRDSGLLGHCVTNWAIRLNPMLAGLPLLKLPALSSIFQEASLSELEALAAREIFGTEEGMQIARKLSLCNSQVRAFTAVQWSGLKDSRPAPEHFLKTKIQTWIDQKEPFWLNKDEMLASMLAATNEAIPVLAEYAETWPVAALWLRCGQVQLQYLELLQALLLPLPDSALLHSRLETLREQIMDLYQVEQTPRSAAKNAGLIIDPLVEYLGEI